MTDFLDLPHYYVVGKTNMISMCGQKATATTPSEGSERGVQTTQSFFY